MFAVSEDVFGVVERGESYCAPRLEFIKEG